MTPGIWDEPSVDSYYSDRTTLKPDAMTTKTAEILTDVLRRWDCELPPGLVNDLKAWAVAERQRADTLAASLAQALERVKELEEVLAEERQSAKNGWDEVKNYAQWLRDAEASLATALAAGRSKGLEEARQIAIEHSVVELESEFGGDTAEGIIMDIQAALEALAPATPEALTRDAVVERAAIVRYLKANAQAAAEHGFDVEGATCEKMARFIEAGVHWRPLPEAPAGKGAERIGDDDG